MQKYLFLILFCFVNIGNVFTQLNKSSHIEAGMFVCKLNKYLIYIQDEEMQVLLLIGQGIKVVFLLFHIQVRSFGFGQK